jgi:hypothetical protein
MRKMMLLAALVAIAALMLAAAPALARDNDRHDNDRNNNHNNNRFFDNDDDLRFVFFDHDNDFFDNFDRNDFLNRDNEQDADSGDVDQSFNVTGGGANSNQCVGLQGVANTGNAQNQIGITQLDNFDDFDHNNFDHNDFDHNRNFFHNDGFNHFDRNGGDFSVEDSGASLEVNPVNTTSCDQQVNQAATASG